MASPACPYAPRSDAESNAERLSDPSVLFRKYDLYAKKSLASRSVRNAAAFLCSQDSSETPRSQRCLPRVFGEVKDPALPSVSGDQIIFA